MVDAAQQRGLPGSRRADQAGDLTGLHDEVDAFENVKTTEALVHRACQDHRRRRGRGRLREARHSPPPASWPVAPSASASVRRGRAVILRDAPRANRFSRKYWPTISRLVIPRYHVAATSSSGIGRKITPEI